VPIVLATIATTSGAVSDVDVFSIAFVLVVVFTLVQAPVLPRLARRLGVAESGQAHEVEVESAPLAEVRAELIQVSIPDGSRLAGVSVQELRLPPGALVTMITRAGQNLVPEVSTRLSTGDRLLVVAPAYERDRVERRLRAVSRAGRLAGWFGEDGAQQ
jgi:cell volume regulation protein A